MTRPPYFGILFDLDGTLVDSLELILSSYRHTMAEHVGRVPPDDAWLRTMGMPLRVQLRSFADSPAQLEAMFRTYVAHNAAHHDRLVREFPGMTAAVTALRNAGFRLGVVTSKIRDHARRELRSCGLDGLFTSLVSADDVTEPKPHPQPVIKGLESLDLDPADALFVGDSLYDLQAGRAAGVRTAAALWGPFDRDRLAEGTPDYWLEDISELLVILQATPSDIHEQNS
ncbi:MAG: HAD-IA family hydrolase [Gemmatimonadota bacterium]|nr:MAG: HAD-IA family hydrolase [Gemmatimonadota bacterium]